MPYAATQILASLPGAGVEVDAYIAGVRSDLSTLAAVPDVRLIREPAPWEWGKWYSRNSLFAVTSGQVARLRAQRRLVHQLLVNNRWKPYDIVYQFSQFESPWSAPTAAKLPPIIVHPEVHAAGELRWLRRERHLSRECEPAYMSAALRAVLMARVAAQRRGVSAVDGFIAPSEVFAREIERDYRIEPPRVHVVANPIDLDRFSPRALPRDPAGRLELLYVSRIALRKGVEMVVALSHRLGDLAPEVRLRVVGDKSMFSDYRSLLRDLNPAVATYAGPCSPRDLADLYRGADVLLQPSHYEPFALTVGEALASGLAVVASDRVGATEGVDPRVCRVFPSGSVDALEASVRELLRDLRTVQRRPLRDLARSEAERLFAPDVIARELAAVFRAVAAGR